MGSSGWVTTWSKAEMLKDGVFERFRKAVNNYYEHSVQIQKGVYVDILMTYGDTEKHTEIEDFDEIDFFEKYQLDVCTVWT